MVQKKVGSSKLGIKDDHVKTEKGLLAKLKQSFVHQNDVKSRAELKKKMKKSKSVKLSDSESKSLRPSSLGGAEAGRSVLPPKKQSFTKLAGGSPSLLLTRKPLPPPQPPVNQEPPPQPGKPPNSGGFPGCETSGNGFLTAKKQSTVKQTEGSSPNYMKSTSSFEARKEERSRSPVSNFRNPQSSISVKSSSPKSTLVSSSKGSRSLSRTSSLKLVRTLTKSPSFKPPRSLSKKCSPTALFDEFDAQKPTCSSTLKDSKFPNYLTLSPGSTEAEGTSAMKVCPYTYCSLNGHHHAALPPLKCFLSARRRVLKTQKSFKLGCLSPGRTKPTESDSKIYPVTENLQEGRDFFVEIYTKDSESLSNEVDAEVQENQEMVIDEIDQEKQFSYCSVDEKDQGKILIDAGEFEVCDMDWEALSDNQDSESGYSNSNFENDLTQDVIASCLFLENQELDTCEDLISEEKIEFGGENETQEGGESFQDQGYLCLPHGNQESDYCEDFLSQEIPRVNDEEDLKESECPQDDIGSCLFPEKQELDSCQDFLGQEKSAFDTIDETIEEGKSVQEQGHFCLLDINHESDSIEDFCNQKSDSVEDSHDQESDPIEDSCNQELVGEDSQEDEHSCLSSTNQKVLGKEHSDDDENIDEIKEFELSQAEDKTIEDEAKDHDITKIEVESQDSDEKILMPNRETKNKGLYKRGKKEENIIEDYENPKWGIRGKRISGESAADPSFNPKEPNYLPVEPEEDGEKVDLRHQELDERKNSEEWMVDLALRRAVNNLAPSRKRRVALLVEAFEKVMPIPKYESHFRHNSSNFALSPRPIQACS